MRLTINAGMQGLKAGNCKPKVESPQAKMHKDNKREGAPESSLKLTSQIRLIGWSQKAKDMRSAFPTATGNHPQ
jgi:hypothetical protein